MIDISILHARSRVNSESACSRPGRPAVRILLTADQNWIAAYRWCMCMVAPPGGGRVSTEIAIGTAPTENSGETFLKARRIDRPELQPPPPVI